MNTHVRSLSPSCARFMVFDPTAQRLFHTEPVGADQGARRRGAADGGERQPLVVGEQDADPAQLRSTAASISSEGRQLLHTLCDGSPSSLELLEHTEFMVIPVANPRSAARRWRAGVVLVAVEEREWVDLNRNFDFEGAASSTRRPKTTTAPRPRARRRSCSRSWRTSGRRALHRRPQRDETPVYPYSYKEEACADGDAQGAPRVREHRDGRAPTASLCDGAGGVASTRGTRRRGRRSTTCTRRRASSSRTRGRFTRGCARPSPTSSSRRAPTPVRRRRAPRRALPPRRARGSRRGSCSCCRRRSPAASRPSCASRSTATARDPPPRDAHALLKGTRRRRRRAAPALMAAGAAFAGGAGRRRVAAAAARSDVAGRVLRVFQPDRPPHRRVSHGVDGDAAAGGYFCWAAPPPRAATAKWAR